MGQFKSIYGKKPVLERQHFRCIVINVESTGFLALLLVLRSTDLLCKKLQSFELEIELASTSTEELNSFFGDAG